MAVKFRIENGLNTSTPYATVLLPRIVVPGFDGEETPAAGSKSKGKARKKGGKAKSTQAKGGSPKADPAGRFQFAPWHRCRPCQGASEEFQVREVLSLQVEAPAIEDDDGHPVPSQMSRPTVVRAGYTYSVLWHAGTLIVREDTGREAGTVWVRYPADQQRNQRPVHLHWSYGAWPADNGQRTLWRGYLLGSTLGVEAGGETWMRLRKGAYLLPLPAHEASDLESLDVELVRRHGHLLRLSDSEPSVAEVRITLVRCGEDETSDGAEESAAWDPAFDFCLFSTRRSEILRGTAVPPGGGESEPS